MGHYYSKDTLNENMIWNKVVVDSNLNFVTMATLFSLKFFEAFL